MSSFISMPADPRWGSFWAILRLKTSICVLAGIWEEAAYRCVYILTTMLSLSCYEAALSTVLAHSEYHISLAQTVLISTGTIGFISSKRPVIARLSAACFIAALTIHFGGVLAYGKRLGAMMDKNTLGYFADLFGEDSKLSPWFTTALILTTAHFCAGHAYQADVVSVDAAAVDDLSTIGNSTCFHTNVRSHL
jgi:hypothetical protein